MVLHILWASMYGGAEEVAYNLKDLAESRNLEVVINELNEVSIGELAEISNLAVVSSTTGQGDLPSNGEAVDGLLVLVVCKIESCADFFIQVGFLFGLR